MKKLMNLKWISGGFAMFAMFFGAGNLIFPLILGQETGFNVGFAMSGLFITGVIVPFTGLLSITLFDGDYMSFFKRIGNIPGSILTLLVLLLIGPFGALPRVISFTYSTCVVFFPILHLLPFAIVFAVITFLFCVKKQGIVDLIGTILTPVLLISLAIILFVALSLTGYEGYKLTVAPVKAFSLGFSEGYNTMDLLGAFFFSSIVCASIDTNKHETPRKVFLYLLKAIGIAAFLLTAVYTGLAFASAHLGDALSTSDPANMLGTLGLLTLGPFAGIVVAIAVGLSCLTTAIALAAVSADFITVHIFQGKIKYIYSLVGVLFTSVLVSLLDFSGIVKLLGPVLMICYPALIVLSLLNIAYKLTGFRVVKIPFYIILLLSIVQSFI